MINDKIRSLIFQPGFQRYFLNTGWMFLEKFFRLLVSVFVGVYVARYLGPSDFGLLNYALSIVGILSAFSILGLDQVVIREFIKGEIKREKLLGNAIILRLIGSFIALAVITLFVITGDTDYETALLLYLVTIGLFFDAFSVIDWFFQSQVKSKYVVRCQLIGLTLTSIFRIALINLNASLWWFAFSYALEYFIIAICLLYFYLGQNKAWRWTIKRKDALWLLKLSWPLILTTLAINLYMKIDQVMIKWMMGNEASGVYAVVVRLSEMWNFVPMAICASLFPAIINSKLTDESVYRKRLQMLLDFMVILSVAISIPVTFLSEFIIEALYGQAYHEAAAILVIYIWSTVFIFIGVANGKWIISENLQVYQMINTGIALALNVILNIILIKLIGLDGAAYSTLISYAFSAYLGLSIFKKTRHIFVQCSGSLNVFALGKRIMQQLQIIF